MHQFGFIGDNEHILAVDIEQLPATFFIQVKKQDKKEVEVVRRKINGT